MVKVKIYSTPTCHYCQQTKKFLEENNIEFEDINIAEDDKAREEMVKKTGQMGVPVIEIDGTTIIGFDKPALKQALGI